MHDVQLILNIGNTRVQWAALDRGRFTPDAVGVCTAPEFVERLDTAHDSLPARIKRITAACVVPAMRTVLLERFGPNACRFVAAETAGSVLDFNSTNPRTLGADRVANAVAAARDGIPVLVIDCGTAITLEAVDERNAFHSIAILPGRRILRRALNSFTGQLPDVPLADDLAPISAANTEEAIRNGCDRGAIGAIVALTNDAIARFNTGENPRVILTGGDADFFSHHLSIPHRVDPFLTLRGIAALA